MEIRKYIPSDCSELIELFRNTVTNINAKDYSKAQISAWLSSPNINPVQWNLSLMEHTTFVAIEDNQIVGFSDIDSKGYLDRLYVHQDWQGKGIASSLLTEIKKVHPGMIITHASITAKPFFEKKGFTVIKEQQVERQGILLTNYVMNYIPD